MTNNVLFSHIATKHEVLQIYILFQFCNTEKLKDE